MQLDVHKPNKHTTLAPPPQQHKLPAPSPQQTAPYQKTLTRHDELDDLLNDLEGGQAPKFSSYGKADLDKSLENLSYMRETNDEKKHEVLSALKEEAAGSTRHLLAESGEELDF